MTKFWIFEVEAKFTKKNTKNSGVKFVGSHKLGGTKFFLKTIWGETFLIRKILFKFLFKLWANKNYNKFDGGQIFFKNTKF